MERGVRGWADLAWLGWAGLGWAGLGWTGLGLAGRDGAWLTGWGGVGRPGLDEQSPGRVRRRAGRTLDPFPPPAHHPRPPPSGEQQHGRSGRAADGRGEAPQQGEVARRRQEPQPGKRSAAAGRRPAGCRLLSPFSVI